MEDKFRILDIKHGTIVDGVGLRTAIYFAGCKHQCPECHNPQSWDMNGGEVMTASDILTELEREKVKYVTLTGGDPLFHDLKALATLIYCMRVVGVENVWLYTGFTFDYLIGHEEYSKVLPLVDVVVDGPYVASMRTTDLPFRGSSNQRLIDVKASINNNVIIEYQL